MVPCPTSYSATGLEVRYDVATKYQVEMPIVEQVNKVLFENKSAKDAVAELMLRDKKVENSTLVWEA